MAKKIKISICIVTYNNQDSIRSTVKSLLDNIPSEYDYSFYIVDNNSHDKTISLLSEYKNKLQIIELNHNKGFGYGHNQVLNIIETDYHFVVNPDIIVENSEQIRKMIEYLEENHNVGLLSPLILNPDLSIQYLCKTNPTVFDMFIRRVHVNFFRKRQDKYVMKDTGYTKVMNVEYVSGSFMVFRTNVFKIVKGFDERFFLHLEDADISRSVNLVSEVIFYPHARVIHSWAREGHKKFKIAMVTVKSMVKYFKKWGWKFK